MTGTRPTPASPTNGDTDRRHLIVGGTLIAALVAAVVVWIVPMPFLSPPSIEELASTRSGASGPPGSRSPQFGPSIEDIEERYVRPAEPWPLLGEPLTSLIDPPPEPEEVQEEISDIDIVSTEGAGPVTPPRDPPPSLAWRYVGYMGNDENAWAMIEIAGQQRVYGVGDAIRDRSWVNGETAEIIEVRPSGVIVRTSQEIEYEFKRASTQEGPPTTPGRWLDARTGA
ncbi:MAG: hypothetical protein AAGI30_09135 [Planctomycetota bacterium]